MPFNAFLSDPYGSRAVGYFRSQTQNVSIKRSFLCGISSHLFLDVLTLVSSPPSSQDQQRILVLLKPGLDEARTFMEIFHMASRQCPQPSQ